MFFSDTMLNMQTLLKHVFYCRNTVFFEGTVARKMNETCKTHAQNLCLESVRKIHKKMEQKLTPKGRLETSKGVPFTRHFCVWFSTCFWDHFWIENGSKKGSKMRRKITQNGLPRQGVILELFWVDFWVILDQFGGHFWIDFGLISIGSLAPILVQWKQQEMERNRQKLHEIIGHSEKWKEIAGNGGT